MNKYGYIVWLDDDVATGEIIAESKEAVESFLRQDPRVTDALVMQSKTESVNS